MTNKSIGVSQKLAAVITLNTESLSTELSCSAITKTFALLSIILCPLFLVIESATLLHSLP